MGAGPAACSRRARRRPRGSRASWACRRGARASATASRLGDRPPAAARARCFPTRLAAILVRGSRSASRWAGRPAGCASRGPCAGCCASCSTTIGRWSAPTGVSFGHRFTIRARSRSRPPSDYAETLREARGRAAMAERRRPIREGLDALGGWSDPTGKLEEVVYLVESPARARGSLRRALPRAPGARDRDGDAVAPALLPARRRALRVRRERRRPDTRARRATSACSRAGSRTRRSRSSATSRVGIDGLAERLGVDHVRRRRRLAAPTRPTRLVRLVEELGGGEASREAARLAKADQAAELVREFPDLEGHIGAEYARLRRLSRGGVPAIEEQYLPDAAGGPLPATEAGRVLAAADKVDNLTVAFSLGQRPTGLARPVRAAPRGDRPLPARARGRASRSTSARSSARPPAARRAGRRASRTRRRTTSPTSSPSAWRACSTCRSSSSARRARPALARARRRSRARVDAGVALDASRVSSALHTVYTRADRLAGKQADGAATLDDPRLAARRPSARSSRRSTARRRGSRRPLAEDDFERGARGGRRARRRRSTGSSRRCS